MVIRVGIGDVLKSNGFFLMEPSACSQFMALGLIIEVLSARRIATLARFATGLLLSFSGTCWIVLAAFGRTAFVGLGRRGAVIGLGALLIPYWFFSSSPAATSSFPRCCSRCCWLSRSRGCEWRWARKEESKARGSAP